MIIWCDHDAIPLDFAVMIIKPAREPQSFSTTMAKRQGHPSHDKKDAPIVARSALTDDW
jgi:hypothetical protein